MYKLAVVPTFNRQFDTAPVPSDWDNLIMRRVLYDPDPITGIDRSLQGYLSAISYGRALLDAKLFPHAFADGLKVVEAAWQSLPMNHGYSYVLCVIPLFDGDIDRKGWFTQVGHNGVTALARVAMYNNLNLKLREITGIWAMEVLHAIAGLPDLYKVKPDMGEFDNMAYNSGTHSCAYLKWAVGWLGDGDLATHAIRQRNYDLHSIGVSPPPPGRVSAVRLPARTSGNTFWVEARLKSDVYEKGFASLTTGELEFRGLPSEGVIVYETVSPNDLEKTFFRSMLKVGQKYTNAAEGISVSVNSILADGMSVHVTGPDPCPALMKRMKNLANKLDEEPGPDVNERKKIIKEVGELRRKALQLGCIET